MRKFIYLYISIFIYISGSLSGQVINNPEIEEKTGIKRNVLYNLEEIKVRWKKAALENCPGGPCPLFSEPGSCSSIVATPTGPYSASVSFVSPTTDGGSPITSYIVTATSTPSAPAKRKLSALITASGTSSPILVTGLTYGVNYIFSVIATNGVGSSPSISTTTTVTPCLLNTASAPSSTPSLTVNSALTDITISTTIATGIGTATGLPAGLSAFWSASVITISGTPTATGSFSYEIPLTGGCGNVKAMGSITVNGAPACAVGTASSTPTMTENTALSNITHATTSAMGIGTATGLPTGVTAAWFGNVITISGTPSATGTFNYTIPLTGTSCSAVNATGTITVTAACAVGTASSTPTLTVSTALTNITHATTSATGIGTATGLPAGVTAAWSGNVITISGTPSATGTFNYIIPLTGTSCSAVNATGTITVNANIINYDLGNALSFDGSNDYVAFPSSSTIDNLGIGSFTMEAMINGTLSGTRSIIRKTSDYNLFIVSGKMVAEVWTAGKLVPSSWQKWVGSSTIADNTWTQIAAVWNGTSFTFYINGVVEPTTNSSGTISGTENLNIGKSANYGEPFSGMIDEVRIWNIARSQLAIQNTMGSSLAGNETGLIAYYNFNNGTAGGDNTGITTLTDNSSHNNNGTLTSFALTGTSSNWVSHSIITSGLILNLDASNTASYPGSGTVWTDLSGSSNNMSLLNGASYDPSNRNSILFDGVNDYAGRSSAMNTGQNFTVSVWMYATLLGSTRTSLVANSYNYSGGNGWFFCTNAGGTPNSFFLSIGSDNPVKVSSSNILTLNTWNYLTAVIRSGGRYIDLYKNGVLISGTSTDLGARTITYNYANFSIGFRDPLGTTDPFKGNIGSTQIYNQALTAADILANYNATKGRYGL